jgi:hypothetical protein
LKTDPEEKEQKANLQEALQKAESVKLTQMVAL